MAQRIAHAQAGQRPGLGQGTDHQQLRIAVDQGCSGLRTEIDIRLIDHHHGIGITRQQTFHFRQGQRHAGWGIGIGKDDAAIRPGLQIVIDRNREVGTQRDLARLDAIQAGVNGIETVRNVGMQQRRRMTQQGHEGMGQHFVRAVADEDLLGLQPVMVCNRGLEPCSLRVWVQTQIARGLRRDSLQHLVAGRIGAFVGVELDQPIDARLFARHIRGQTVNDFAPESAHGSSVSAQPHFGGAGVRGQAFAVGQHAGDTAELLRALGADLDDAGALDEVVHPQRRGEPGRARSGQDMVGPGAVVAERLGGVGAEKQRASVLERGHILMRVLRGNLQVFRRDTVGQFASLRHVAHADERTAAVQRGGDDVLARHVGQQPVDGLGHGVDIGRIRTEQDALRQFVMLGLAEQIHRHPVGRRAAVGEHQNLGRPGDHVDAANAEHPPLGRGHIGVARADDFVHRGHGGRAVSQSAHRLRPADGEGPAHAGHGRCGQHQRIALAARRGHDHDDLLHTRHMRRNGVHQYRRGIGRLAARHIDAHAVEWGDLLAQQSAVFIAVLPALADLLQLALVVAAHPDGGRLQRAALLRSDGGKRGL